MSGKGGVGKSTVAAALGMASAGRGRRTLLVEVASQERMSRLFDQRDPIGYHVTPVYPGLDALSVDLACGSPTPGDCELEDAVEAAGIPPSASPDGELGEAASPPFSGTSITSPTLRPSGT